MKKLILAATTLSALAVPGAADARKRAPAPPPPPVVRVVPSDPVEAYYFNHREAPLWFRNADTRAAVGRLPALLRRAQVEGLANGPQLAAQVEAATLRAATSNSPADIRAAELAASNAWVAYVQTIKKAPAGMLFGYPQLAPQGARPDQILLTAAASPSLALHLDRVASPNTTYTQLRDAAWAGFQANPAAGVDGRLLSNMERARVLPAGGRYIVVNSADARLTMFENGQPVDSMKVVVGTDKTPTPMIASMIFYTTFNPYWNVPGNLIQKTMGPNALKGGDTYLKSKGYEVMSDWTENATVLPASSVDWKAVIAGQKQVRLRQLPGASNSMGRYKFNFRNSEDIYLHDTPQKEYFALANRAKSNGCIRLEDAKRLARWLMQAEPVAPSAQPELHVKLPQGVPVYVTYLTVKPDGGKLTYLTDYYGWDGRPDRQVAAASSQVPRAGL